MYRWNHNCFSCHWLCIIEFQYATEAIIFKSKRSHLNTYDPDAAEETEVKKKNIWNQTKLTCEAKFNCPNDISITGMRDLSTLKPVEEKTQHTNKRFIVISRKGLFALDLILIYLIRTNKERIKALENSFQGT